MKLPDYIPVILRDSRNVVIAEAVKLAERAEIQFTFRLRFPPAIDETSVAQLTARIQAMLLTLEQEHP